MPYLDKLNMGPGTYRVKTDLYKLNRTRLVERLKKTDVQNPVILLEGGKELPMHTSDQSYRFRQEAFFQWTFGILESDCYGIIDVKTGKSVGFFPELPDSYQIWSGRVEKLRFFKEKYGLDKVYYVGELAEVLRKLPCPTLLILEGVNSDSGNKIKDTNVPEGFRTNTEVLYHEMCDLRSVKTRHELDLLRYILRITSEAHKAVMRFVKPGRYQYQCESTFIHYCHTNCGSKTLNYDAICCSGRTNSILHYIQNDQEIKDGDLCLFDMGSTYFGYTADVTCTFPANGRFTPDQKIIYQAIFDCVQAVLDSAKPGIGWLCLHNLANQILLAKLKDAGLLTGDIKEMMAADLPFVFQPCGLGHLMGLNVHDVGGYLKESPERPQSNSAKFLRTCRKLVEGMVITVEPGCYFIDYLLQKAFDDPKQSKFLVRECIDRFRPVGGVRIEENIVITKDGCEVLNSVPRTVEAIEAWMCSARSAC